MIRQLTEDAFRPKAFSDGTEGALVGLLRDDGALTISTVATKGDTIVGHVAFSPAVIGDHGDWFALGPVSVREDLQRTGIGSKLIEDGLSKLRDRNAKGCVLTGDPRYYGRFGFQASDALTLGGKPDRHLQILVFGQEKPKGEVQFHPAFNEA